MVAIAGGKREVVLHMLQAIKKLKNLTSHRETLNLPAKNNKTIVQWAIESDHTVLVEVVYVTTAIFRLYIYRQSYYLQAVLQIDLHLATECDPDAGKTLLHIAASSGAMNTTKVIGYTVCLLHQKAMYTHRMFTQ